jgi:hypothetical protein
MSDTKRNEGKQDRVLLAELTVSRRFWRRNRLAILAVLNAVFSQSGLQVAELSPLNRKQTPRKVR